MLGLLAVASLFLWASPLSALKQGPGLPVATKTSYYVHANLKRSIELEPDCTPVLFWHLARHGTRYPGIGDITCMNEELPDIRDNLILAWSSGLGFLDEKTIHDLSTWSLNISPKLQGYLHRAGVEESREMGERWRARLKRDLNIDSHTTEAFSTDTQRTRASGAAFMQGFLKEEKEINIDDHMLGFYHICPAYEQNVANSTKPRVEAEKFEETVLKEMVESLSHRAGVELDTLTVDLMFEICRYETAWNAGVVSPWCGVFRPADIEVLVFREDLVLWYTYGHAYDIVKQMTQPLWHDLITRLRELETTGRTSNSSVLLFGHIETLLPFIASMGLYRDPGTFTASDWPARDRKWKTSLMGSFTSNLDIVVTKCREVKRSSSRSYQANNRSNLKKKFKVALFQQERNISLPSRRLADLENFLAEYSPLAEDVDFEEVCRV